MSFEERMWGKVSSEGLDNSDSSTENMLEAIEAKKDRVYEKINEVIAKIKEAKILLMNENEAVVSATKKDLEDLKIKKINLESELRLIFEEESSTEFFDDRAAERPLDTLVSEAGGRQKPDDIDLNLN